jgi:uncharacterized protein YjiS (DUF1127 family)
MQSVSLGTRRHGDNFRLSAALRNLPGDIVRWHRRLQQRHSLADLDNRMLSDIGVSPADRDIECAKPFWQP